MGSSKAVASHCSGPAEPTPSKLHSPAATLSQRMGNQLLHALLHARLLQAKLTISHPHDEAEQEADRVADAVMRAPAPTPQVVPDSVRHVQRASDSGAAPMHPGSDDEIETQRAEDSTSAPTVDAALESSISALSGQGNALPASVRSFMEPRFNADFGAVRVHTDARAHQLARSVSAHAFTVGKDIVFAAGSYAPETPSGKRLLAHELTHVLQQSSTTDPRRIQRQTAPPPNGPTPMSAAHAGGAMGERDAAFALGQQGFRIVLGPAGPSGHGLTTPGLDILAYHPQRNELWYVDNKASGGTGTVQSASAITANLATNLRTALAQVQNMPAFPERAAVIQHLQNSLSALAQGLPLPQGTRAIVTNAGGYHSNVSRNLTARGIDFLDLTGQAVRDARRQDLATARGAGVSTGRSVVAPPASSTSPAPATNVANQTALPLPVPSPSNLASPPPAASPVPSSNVSAPTSAPRIAPVGRGGSFVAAGSLGAGTHIATILLNQYLQERFAQYRAESEREFSDRALDEFKPQLASLLANHREKIAAAQAKGRKVSVFIYVELAMVDSNESGVSIGSVPYGSEVVDAQILYEGDQPKWNFPYTSLIGDLARGFIGASKKYRDFTFPLPGTDFAVRRRNEVLALVDAVRGVQAAEFEELVLRSRFGGLPNNLLREYAQAKHDLEAVEPYVVSTRRREQEYWQRMQKLVDAPLSEVIAQAKVKLVPLQALRDQAIRMRAADAQSGSRWSEIIDLIDAPLEDRLAAERQRFIWQKGPAVTEVAGQQSKVDSLRRRVAELQNHVKELHEVDARTAEEIAAHEPPHAPWSRIATLQRNLQQLRDDLAIETQLLNDMKRK